MSAPGNKFAPRCGAHSERMVERGARRNGHTPLGLRGQQSPTVTTHRAHPVRRARGKILCSQRQCRYGRIDRMRWLRDELGRVMPSIIFA